MGGGLAAVQSFWSNKKGHLIFISVQMSPLPVFYDCWFDAITLRKKKLTRIHDFSSGK